MYGAGAGREELTGGTDYDFHTKEQADIFWEKDDLVFDTESINVNEEVYTDPKGEVRAILNGFTFSKTGTPKFLNGTNDAPLGANY